MFDLFEEFGAENSYAGHAVAHYLLASALSFTLKSREMGLYHAVIVMRSSCAPISLHP